MHDCKYRRDIWAAYLIWQVLKVVIHSATRNARAICRLKGIFKKSYIVQDFRSSQVFNDWLSIFGPGIKLENGRVNCDLRVTKVSKKRTPPRFIFLIFRSSRSSFLLLSSPNSLPCQWKIYSRNTILHEQKKPAHVAVFMFPFLISWDSLLP